MSGDSYMLNIEWDRPGSDSPNPPRSIGPFKDRDEADQWAKLNVPNGSWEVWPLTYPWLHAPNCQNVGDAAR